ncbi:MAG: hypothetical protein ACQGVK_12940 [Myxococcota bacterium]
MHRLRLLALTAGLLLALAAGGSQAATITFSDYQGAASGNTASISQDGFTLDITASPSDYDLTIGGDGLGVACNGRRWACWGNDPGEIDASHGESVTVDFGEVVRLYDVDLLNLYDGILLPDEEAEIAAAGVLLTVDGDEYFFEEGAASVDFGGILTDYVSFTAVGMFYSDFSVSSLTIGSADAGGPASGGGPAMPEPSAALAFAAGLVAVGRRTRRG